MHKVSMIKAPKHTQSHGIYWAALCCCVIVNIWQVADLKSAINETKEEQLL